MLRARGGGFSIYEKRTHEIIWIRVCQLAMWRRDLQGEPFRTPLHTHTATLSGIVLVYARSCSFVWVCKCVCVCVRIYRMLCVAVLLVYRIHRNDSSGASRTTGNTESRPIPNVFDNARHTRCVYLISSKPLAQIRTFTH